MVDTDGQYDYSNVETVTLVSEVIDIQIIPNPVRDICQLQFNASNEYEIQVYLTNVLGEVVEIRQLNTQKGSNNLEMDIAHLPKGIYILTIEAGEQRWVEKLVKG
jgi:ribosomal protein L2